MATTSNRKRQNVIATFPTLAVFKKTLFALFADARVSGKWSGRLQILDDSAEIDRLGIERFIFCDLRPIQNLEAVALEHFFAAPAFERDDLAANAFFTGAIEIAQVRAHQGACGRNFSRLWQKVDVKMRDTSRLSRDFVPPVHQDPANETTGAFIIAEVTGQRAEKQPDILVKRVELILQRLSRTQQVAANLAVHLQKKRRFRFVIGVISGEKISK